uniref:PhoH-like protein n=1 Tax=viral metagenome TaxID=1070528 RepID=A0A6C0HYT5_9ZZZZ
MNKMVGSKNHEDFQQVKPGKHNRFRKVKKINEKELLGIYFADSQDILQESTSLTSQIPQTQYLSQRERANIENKFTKPKNMHQDQYVNMLKQKQKKIIVVAGPAGTGKTLFATEYGIRNFMLGTYERLVFTRPSVSVDEDIGYLPGSLEDKMAPWIRPIYDILYQHMSPVEVSRCIEEKTIEIAPLGFMRGRTFKNTWIVADEMQNSTISQMKMLLTRLGENSRVVVTGDLDQHDRVGEINGLEDFLNKFRGKRSSSISSFEFEKSDIQREEVVKEVLDLYSSENIPYYKDSDEEEVKENV